MKEFICKKCGKIFKNYKKRQLCFECRPTKNIPLDENTRERYFKKKSVKYTAKKMEKAKLIAFNYKGEKCQICGYNKCKRALDFHHVNPSEKSFNISSEGYSKSFELLKTELDKCILVCSNCHREIHDGLIDISSISLDPINKNAFDEVLNQKAKTQIKSLDEKIIKKLPNLHSVGNETEFDIVSHYKRRTVARPDTYEDFLAEFKELNFNYCAMGRKYGVSDNAIRKWEKSYKKYGF